MQGGWVHKTDQKNDELFENDQSIQKIRTSHYSAKLLRLPPIR